MKEALIVAIVFGSLVLIPTVIGGTIILSIKLLKGGTSRKDQAEDSKIIQEIYQELKAKGGLEVAREIDALDLLFREEFEVPFRPGDYLRHKVNKHIYKFVRIDDTITPPIKRLVYENMTQGGTSSFEPDSINLFIPISQAEAEMATRRRGGRKRRPCRRG